MLTATLTDTALGTAHTIFRGRVEHSYRAALYVRNAASGRLAVVAIEDVGGLPGGMLVDGISDLRTLNAAGHPLVVDLSKARSWSPHLPAAAKVARTDGLGGRLLLARALAAAGAGGPLRDPFADAAAPHIASLRSALVSHDTDAARAAALALIGLGVGLTPSGDDFLVGLLAGLEATGHPARLPLAASIAAQAPRRTTTIGANALEHAAAGEFTERLHDVVVAIADERAAGLARGIARAMAYGATSGADTLVGLFLALEIAAAETDSQRAAA